MSQSRDMGRTFPKGSKNVISEDSTGTVTNLMLQLVGTKAKQWRNGTPFSSFLFETSTVSKRFAASQISY
ncbi:hypothetical protein TNCT_636421 [Trichonephila clavata]|uniref:Uncharacterized protein n=1 Tax=Trichonephila clavata TaxID=2740835 RepID=A0A8X6FSN4_TRICU|nr:hypothetical protein TNCT_636421 [Trichonephila clavata]